MKFYYTYVLQSEKDGKFYYIGSTSNLQRRFADHNAGRNISTNRRKPFKLVFYEAFPTRADAERRELYLKTTKGKTTLRQMLRDFLY